MTLPAKKTFNPSFPITDGSGRPVQNFRDYISALDALVAAMAAGNLSTSLVVAVDDAAAAAAGVAIGAAYRAPTVGVPPNTTSALRVRVS